MGREASGKRRVKARATSGKRVRRARLTETTERRVAERTHARGQPKRALTNPVKAKMGKRTPSVGPKKGVGQGKKS